MQRLFAAILQKLGLEDTQRILNSYGPSGGIPFELHGQGWDNYRIGRAFRLRKKHNGQPEGHPSGKYPGRQTFRHTG